MHTLKRLFIAPVIWICYSISTVSDYRKVHPGVRSSCFHPEPILQMTSVPSPCGCACSDPGISPGSGEALRQASGARLEQTGSRSRIRQIHPRAFSFLLSLLLPKAIAVNTVRLFCQFLIWQCQNRSMVISGIVRAEETQGDARSFDGLRCQPF